MQCDLLEHPTFDLFKKVERCFRFEKFSPIKKMSASLLQIFEAYQKARVQFVQAVAEAATRPQNVDVMQNAGVMQLLRPLLLDNVRNPKILFSTSVFTNLPESPSRSMIDKHNIVTGRGFQNECTCLRRCYDSFLAVFVDEFHADYSDFDLVSHKNKSFFPLPLLSFCFLFFVGA